MTILDPEVHYLFPDTKIMEKWFDEFNNRFFDNDLEKIELKAGWYGNEFGSFISPCDCSCYRPEECLIRLNRYYYAPELNWESTMIHEMIHYYVYKHYGNVSRTHGKEFQKEAKRISEASEFRISTHSSSLFFLNINENQLGNLERRCQEDFIIGLYHNYKIDKLNYAVESADSDASLDWIPECFAFKTKKRYIPELIMNMRGVNAYVVWLSVNASCQRLALMRNTTSFLDFRKKESVMNHIYDVDDLKLFTGDFEYDLLGETHISYDKVEGYFPEGKPCAYLKTYNDDAKIISQNVAKTLISIYAKKPKCIMGRRPFTEIVFLKGKSYRICLNSRYLLFCSRFKNRIEINPLKSAIIRQGIINGDETLIEKELTKAIIIN